MTWYVLVTDEDGYMTILYPHTDSKVPYFLE